MSGAGVLTLGETLGLLTPVDDGPVQYADVLALRTGGAESNVAIALARLGVRACWIGRVGDDPIGRRIVRDLRGEGVEVRAVVEPGAPTAMMIKERRGGAQQVWYHRRLAAGSALRRADVPDELVARADLLHVTGISLGLSDSAADAVLHAVEVAVATGVPVSFDVNHRERVWAGRSSHEAYGRVARAAAVVFGDPAELAHLVGEVLPSGDAARRVRALGPREVVVKDGPRGATALVGDRLFEEPAVPIRTVDTVGAGDAFVAAYLAGMLDGADAAVRLRAACRAGALACLHRGDWEGSPTRAELEDLGDADAVVR